MKWILFLILLNFSAFTVEAQNSIQIKGSVKDATTNELLTGVSVVVLGTNLGVTTDFDGNFAINVPVNGILQFSYMGYVSQEVKITKETILSIKLIEDTQALDEVVIVGYSSQKKSTLTGAVSPINIEDMERRRVADLRQALQGQVAGVQVTQSTGAPGEEIEITIRGLGTIGNNSPLYVIDGVPTRELAFINPSDIETMTVLKDASAAAIYGSRASAGVIVITTKSGTAGKTNLELNYYSGLQFATNLPKMLNAEQYLNVVEQAWNNAGYTGSNPYTNDKGRSDFADTNWLKELFEPGYLHNVQITTSGGNDKLQYLLSAGYVFQDGIVIYDNDKYKRFNLRTNISANVSERIKLGTNMQFSYAVQDKLSSKGDAPGIIRHALLRPPVIPVYKSPTDPTYSTKDPFTDLPFYVHNDRSSGGWESDKYEWTQNPIALAYFTDDTRSHFKTFGNLFGEIAFLPEKNLKFRTNLGVDLNFKTRKSILCKFWR